MRTQKLPLLAKSSCTAALPYKRKAATTNPVVQTLLQKPCCSNPVVQTLLFKPCCSNPVVQTVCSNPVVQTLLFKPCCSNFCCSNPVVQTLLQLAWYMPSTLLQSRDGRGGAARLRRSHHMSGQQSQKGCEAGVRLHPAQRTRRGSADIRVYTSIPASV
jgi:hypothetical protein